jgi:hypothetical protein
VLGAAGLKKLLPVVTTARSRAHNFGSVAAAAIQLFFACEKKFHCARRVHAGNSSRRHEVFGAAGLKKLLPVVTTARSRAHNFGSVAAAAISFFLRAKKSFTVHAECTQAIARGGMRCLALRCDSGPKTAPTGGQGTFSTVFWYK